MARVNIVKRIKNGGRWIMRSVPKKSSGEWDWKSLPEGRYYIEWYDDGVRRREPAGTTVAQVLEIQRRKKHQLDGLALGLVSALKPARRLRSRSTPGDPCAYSSTATLTRSRR